MTYIIAEPCIDIKDLSCVDVCPVDCIHEFERILIIDPEECIDCGACEPECPVEAIFPEDALPEKWEPFVKINYAYGDGADVINKLADEYATEHTAQTPPLDKQRSGSRSSRRGSGAGKRRIRSGCRAPRPTALPTGPRWSGRSRTRPPTRSSSSIRSSRTSSGLSSRSGCGPTAGRFV